MRRHWKRWEGKSAFDPWFVFALIAIVVALAALVVLVLR
jgi:hypothetical protein